MAITSLFGTSPAEIILAQQKEAQQEQLLRNQMIAQQGAEFGPFRGLYQAGLRFGDVGAQAMRQSLFPQQADPRLQKATDIQSVLTKYQGQDLTSGDVLGRISSDLANLGYTQEAFGLAQQAAKATSTAKAEARAERGLAIQEEGAKETRYKNNPELLIEEARVLPDDDPRKQSLINRYYDIKQKQKLDVEKAQADIEKTRVETERLSLITDEMRSDSQGNKVNNNGVKIGTFDKTGRYKAPNGTVYSAKAVETARTEHDAASDLLFRLERLTDEDINNAYGSAMDYTTTPGGGLIASRKTYGAQTKINEVGIRSVLNNLQQLKGPSSDKEMAQMIKDFPGYQADPDVMRAWVNRAVQATNRYLKRNESRYGFDTDYGVEDRFKTRETKQKERTEGSTSEWRVL